MTATMKILKRIAIGMIIDNLVNFMVPNGAQIIFILLSEDLDEEDDALALQHELEKIRKERAEEKERQVIF